VSTRCSGDVHDCTVRSRSTPPGPIAERSDPARPISLTMGFANATSGSYRAALLTAALVASFPASAFWGLLGKAAASGGGKAAAATAGKGAAAGVVGAEAAAEFAGSGRALGAMGGASDDVARFGSRSGAADFSTVNAALPPEVAAYLAKPAKDLTQREAGTLMSSYDIMVARAGRTGDFSSVEKLGGSAQASPSRAGAAPSSPSPGPRPTAPSSSSAGLPFEAVRVLAHAAHAGYKPAQAELDRVCTPGTPAGNSLSAQIRYSKPFLELCSSRARS
jgi:hypothetical protein